MNILVKNAKIIDEFSTHHNQVKDIYIENGVITRITNSIDAPYDVLVSHEDLHVSLGWADFKTSIGDPGFEHKETIESTLRLSASGGFTHIGSLPSNQPVTDTKAQVEYQKQKSNGNIVSLHPMGTISKGMKSEELSEMFDLFQNGCSLFTDDTNFVNTGLMYRSLLYTKNFGGKVILNLFEPHLSNGLVNEGIASTRTGIKADASVGELIQLKTILLLVEYLNCSVHITGVSCKESVDIIASAKERGLNITSDVNVMNLLFTEEDVLDFDPLMKVKPVLRRDMDKSALLEGIRSGIIDGIASDHRPVNEEDKNLEFEGVAIGCYQLQTIFSALVTNTDLDLEHIVKSLGTNNRKILVNQENKIEETSKADLTLFSPSSTIEFPKQKGIGHAYFHPFTDKKLKGKVVGVIHNEGIHLNP